MEIKIEQIRVADLKPYAKNTRRHLDFDVDQIAKSIEKFGMCDPIGVWGKDNVIVEGHGRLAACKKLGLDVVPCIRLDHLTDEQRRAYAIAHNKTAELSEWDFDFLAEELEEVDLSDFNFNFGLDSDESISPDDYDDSFSLPDGDKPEICQMTFTLHNEQAELIKYAMKVCEVDITETFGNENKNGNALYEVVRQWAEQRR